MKNSLNFIKDRSSAFKLSNAICDAINKTYNKYWNTETSSKPSLESLEFSWRKNMRCYKPIFK